MGWKSTTSLSRDEAIHKINDALKDISSLPNETLEDVLEVLIGDVTGENFSISDSDEEEDLIGKALKIGLKTSYL